MSASSNELGTAKKRILVFCDYFLPSRKGGGGTWTVVNLIDRFCDRYDFFVVTRNHESRTDLAPFKSVDSNAWNTIGNARVYYLSSDRITVGTIEKLTNEISPDGIFLNSVFSKPAVTFLRFRKSLHFTNVPVILAPCGELSQGALSIKRWKKRAFLTFAKAFGLYSGINWKATTSYESEEIRRIFRNSLPHVAADLPPRAILPDFLPSHKPPKEPGAVKLIYYSRIDQKKNLLFLLDILSRVKPGQNVKLTIAGPVDNESYWNKCREKIARLETSISINIVGPVSNDEGLKLLAANHFFILPTLGENFGYVILEALAAGCPMLTTDRTIWNDIVRRNAGWSIPLSDTTRWIETIDRCIDMDQANYLSMSKNARNKAIDWLHASDLEDATEKILTEVIGV